MYGRYMILALMLAVMVTAKRAQYKPYAPTISGVTAEVAGRNVLSISYTLEHIEEDAHVELWFSANEGYSWNQINTFFEGDIGDTSVGEDKKFLWTHAPAGKYWIKLRAISYIDGSESVTDPISLHVAYPEAEEKNQDLCSDDAPYLLYRKAYTQINKRGYDIDPDRKVEYRRPKNEGC